MYDSVFIDNYAGQGGAALGGETGATATVTNCTFIGNQSGYDGNTVSGFSSLVVTASSFYDYSGGLGAVRTTNPADVRNSVFYGGATPAFSDPLGALTAEYNAADSDYSSYDPSNIDLDDGVDASAAVDAADSTTLDVDLADWAARTTNADLSLDTTPPDMGAHYDPAAPYIITFEDTGVIEWTTVNATSCNLDTNGVLWTNLDSGTVVSGSGPYTLYCYGSGGVAVAELP